MVPVVFAKSYNKIYCGNSISASIVFAFGFYSSISKCSISVLVETTVTMVKMTLVFFCEAFRCSVNPQIASSHMVYNTAGVKLQLTASLLLHTRSFLAIVRSSIFFFFSFIPPPHRAWTPFRLSFWMSVKLWLCIGPKWLMLDRRHPPAISWKGCACVWVLILQACVLPYFLLRADSQRYFGVSAASLIFRRDCVFTCTFSGDTPTYACIQEFRPSGFVLKTALFGMTD